ncbi:MAG: primosomal protein N' [Deltaproteobacteria bacterium]|nr:primosomal protein N' [Deltaproteobacteria bacterium]
MAELATPTDSAAAVVRVVLVPAPGRLAPLDYRAPQLLAPGTRVLVPLGSRRAMGVVVGAGSEASDVALRDVLAVLDEAPVLDAPLMRLVAWMADYYLGSLAEVLATALPGVLQIETERRAALVDAAPASLTPAEREVVALLAVGEQAATAITQRLGARGQRALAGLARRGVVRISERLRRESAPTRRQRFYSAAVAVQDADERLVRRRALRAVYVYLRDHPLGRAPDHELRHSFSDAAAKLRALLGAGLVRVEEEEQYRSVLPPAAARDVALALTAAQQAAVEAMAAARDEGFVAWLLHGVTGSGKTEVYLRAIAALPPDAGALVLVPEISLTHQLVERVRARFGDAVAVLHSQLGVGERWDEWRRIARGEARIVVGARSAVFAPLRRLGLIVVDEEHDSSYKEQEGVHYHGRDVAVMRAKLTGCALLLGSATPSMESLANAQAGRYRLLELPERVASRPLPVVRVVDLRGSAGERPPILTPELDAALRANLAAGGQSLLFLNRRGFANALQCRACGEPRMCPNCSVALTVHRGWRALRCHYCDHTIAPPLVCGECGEPALLEWGVGTEQLEALLRERFPGARVARMDRDSTRRKGSQQRLLAEWTAGRFDILIGTQMITKGHDVPGVTLVGVVHADAALNFPDFRAGERTFQLLAQVAGRAGRGDKPGRVVVQTLQPEHYSLRAAATHDYASFAAAELAARRELGYPPFSRLVLLRFEGANATAVDALARQAAQRLRADGGGVAVLGPAPAPLERLRQRYRVQLLLRGPGSAQVRRRAAAALPELRAAARARDVRLVVDVDPQQML